MILLAILLVFAPSCAARPAWLEPSPDSSPVFRSDHDAPAGPPEAPARDSNDSGSAPKPYLPLTDPPTGSSTRPSNDAYETQEDTLLAVPAESGVLANDPGTGVTTLTVSVVSTPLHGSLDLQADGSFTYAPDPDYSGADLFTYRVTGGDYRGTPAEVVLTVLPVNDPPSAEGQELATDEGAPVAITLAGSDRETDPSALVFGITAAPEHGTLSGTPPNLTYTPASGYSGPDAFSYSVTDAGDGTSPVLTSEPAVVNLTVTPVNQRPTAQALEQVTEEDNAVGIVLAGEDAETPPESLVYAIATAPEHGTLTGAAPSLIYTPDADYNGTDAFQYTVTDTGDGPAGPATSAPAFVSLTVGPVNDPPAADPGTVSLAEDGTAAVSLVGHDIETAADALVYTIVTPPEHGTLSGVAPALAYAPAPDYSGPDAFAYTVTDAGDGSAPALTTAEATFTVTVSAVNDPPAARPDTLAGTGARLVTPPGALLANDSPGPADESGQTLAVTGVGTAEHGTVSITPEGIVYERTPGYTGPDRITYTLSDNGTTGSTPDPQTAVGVAYVNGSTALTGLDLPARFGAASLVATQTRATDAGDNINEMDQLFAIRAGRSLRLGITGNLARSGHGVIVMLDTLIGGDSVFTPTGSEISPRLAGLSGVAWDDGFQPDYAVELAATADGLSLDLYDLRTGSRVYLGRTPDGTPAAFAGGSALAMDSTNTAGVTADSAAGAEMATAGIEITLPDDIIGRPAGNAPIRLLAFLLDAEGRLTSQALPGLPERGARLTGLVAPGPSAMDFRSLPGRHFAVLDSVQSASDLPAHTVRWAYTPRNLTGDPGQDAHPPVTSVPTVYQGRAYVVQDIEHTGGEHTGVLVALDTASHSSARLVAGFAAESDGRVLLDGPVSGRVTIQAAGGVMRLYLVTDKGTLYSMDAATGRDVRTLRLLDSPGATSCSTPAVVEMNGVPSVFAGVEDRDTGRAFLVRATDAAVPELTGCLEITGDPFTMPDPSAATVTNVFTSPSVIGNHTRVQIGTYNTTTHPLNGVSSYGVMYTLGTNMTVYNAVKMGPLVAPPTLSRDSAFFYAGDLPGDNSRGFAAFNASNGTLLWERPITGYLNTVPTVDYDASPNAIYFGTTSGYLYALDPVSGQDLGSMPIQPFGETQVTGGLYLSGSSGPSSSLYVPTAEGMFRVPMSEPASYSRYPVASATSTASLTGRAPGSTMVTVSGSGNVFGLVVQADSPADPNAVQRNALLPPGPMNPRNSEGDFIRLNDGRLMFVYTHFVDGANDANNAYLAARFSPDDGKTWLPEDVPMVYPVAGLNVMSVSLRRLADGEIGMFYLRKRSLSDCRPVLRRSRDEGRTWGPAEEVITDEVAYYVMNNDRVFQLPGGRLLAPVALHKGADGSFILKGKATCYLSDDNGRTWRRSKTVLDLAARPDSAAGLQEPGLVQLSDGRLMMFARTDLGCQYVSYSQDSGETWSPVQPSAIRSPTSPASIERVPSTGDLVMVWNDTYDPSYGWLGGPRNPLNVAVSLDDGRTWIHKKVLENAPYGWYCYTAIHFTSDGILLGHCAGDRRINGLETTQMTAFPLSWLYAPAP